MTVGHHLLHVPDGLIIAFSWSRKAGIRCGYERTADGWTLNFRSAEDRSRLLKIIEAQCAALRPYSPAFARLWDGVRSIG